MAWYPASLGCRWSPLSKVGRNRNGSAGSRVARSKSITPSNAPLARIHWFTACRWRSKAAEYRALPSTGVTVAQQIIDRVHARGAKIYGATLTPVEGSARVVDAFEQDDVAQAAAHQDIAGQAVQGARAVARRVGEHLVAGDAFVDNGL